MNNQRKNKRIRKRSPQRELYSFLPQEKDCCKRTNRSSSSGPDQLRILLCLHTQKNNRNCLKKINITLKTDIKVNVPVLLCAVFFCFALFLINDCVDFQCRFLSISQITGGNVYHSSSFLLTSVLNIVFLKKKKKKKKRNKIKNQNKKLNTI